MADPPRKRCLYEILGVSRDSSQEEIRSAYKRLALQLHPDKLAQSGVAAAGDATAAFQELLHAYEVLSDPKERAWYDSHRSQILFSDPSSASKSPPSAFGIDLFSFFSKSVFSGYADTGKGFFKVYGDVFAKIYAQELYFADQLGFPSGTVTPSPLIGNLDSPYSQVTAFYNYWLGFCTIMDFAWVDEYDSSAGQNRRSRRLMEEENKKVRKKARREYNDTVRGLAAFVKKRDKRVLDMQMKKNMQEEKRRAEEKERKKEEDRKRMEQAMMYEEPEWAKIGEGKEMGWKDSDEDERRNKGKGEGELYCVVCSKKFKSEKQWKNHEQSKKHKEKVAELRVLFEEEDEALKEEEGVSVSFDYVPPPEEDESDLDQICEELKHDLALQEERSDEDDKSSILEAMVLGQKNKKKKQNMNFDEINSNGHLGNDEGIGSSHNQRNRMDRRGRRWESPEANFRDDRRGRSESQKDVGQDQIDENNAEGDSRYPSCSVEVDSENSKGDQTAKKSSKLKKQQFDGKEKPAKKDAAPLKYSSKGKKQKASANAPSNLCETCGETFESRNKLFTHLGKTGHAMLKSR